jgi:hypothetical protein
LPTLYTGIGREIQPLATVLRNQGMEEIRNMLERLNGRYHLEYIGVGGRKY